MANDDLFVVDESILDASTEFEGLKVLARRVVGRYLELLKLSQPEPRSIIEELVEMLKRESIGYRHKCNCKWCKELLALIHRAESLYKPAEPVVIESCPACGATWHGPNACIQYQLSMQKEGE